MSHQSYFREKEIPDFGNPTGKVNPKIYVPFDLSDEIVKDGVDWYLKMKDMLGGEEFMVDLYISKFADKLYEKSTERQKPSNQRAVINTPRFSGDVIGLVSNNLFKIEETGSKRAGDVWMGGETKRASNSESKFVESIKSLADEFDRIYATA